MTSITTTTEISPGSAPSAPDGTPPGLTGLSSERLVQILAEMDEATFRADQLRRAAWQPFVTSFEDVRQLPAPLRQRLTSRLRFTTASVVSETPADRGMTFKLLCRLDDGQTVETVAMETPARAGAGRRATVCVSTQVGCAIGCPFCATGQLGLRRSCSASEVIDQVRLAARSLHRHGLGPATHVVYMGMGEPLAAYATTLASVRALIADAGISARRITISTSGVIPGIDRLAEERLPLTLAVSLHAATDELRNLLVPLNRAHPLDRLVASAGAFSRSTGRRLSLEWCLIGGMNDTAEQAAGLVGIARRLRAHVNVIPMNRIDGSPWGPPPPSVARGFLRRLVDAGINVTMRDTRGGGAAAACGQLRAALETRRAPRPDGSLGPPRRR